MSEKMITEHVWTRTDASLFETLVDRDEVMINHVVVPAGGGFRLIHRCYGLHPDLARDTLDHIRGNRCGSAWPGKNHRSGSSDDGQT